MTRQERKNKINAALTTVVVNALVLLIMIFAAAWQSPGSGPGEYPGIEVNLGYDDQGSGDVEPETPIGTEKADDDENPPAQEPVQEPVSSQPEPIAQDEPTTRAIEPTTATDPTSDVEIKEEKKEVKPVEKTPEKKTEEKVEKPVAKPVEPRPEEKKVDKNAVHPGKNTANTAPTENGTGKQGTSGNQGDDEGKEGNKGVEGGTVGAAVYKGKPGGGDGGTGLDLYGWEWDNIPRPNIPDNETGRIVFEIEVDDNGELIRYRKESGTVSAAAERACVAAIQKLTFTKKSGAKVPPVSKGKITFVIRAQ